MGRPQASSYRLLARVTSTGKIIYCGWATFDLRDVAEWALRTYGDFEWVPLLPGVTRGSEHL
jgi:hypothetical protein